MCTTESTLATLVWQEWILYPEVVAALCTDSFEWREDGVIMFKSKDAENVFK